MLKVNVLNFRGIREAKFEVERAAFVCGVNGAGKSSISQAVRGCLTGASPIPGLKKGDAGILINDAEGVDGAATQITAELGISTASWPDGKRLTHGLAPSASPIACGLTSPVEMTSKDAAGAWAEILQCEVTYSDFVDALNATRMTFPERLLDEWGDCFRRRGIDAVFQQIKEEIPRLKGRWEQITGERYGSKKAEAWKPDGWTNDLYAAKADVLQAEKDAAEKEWAKALAHSGMMVTSEEMAELEKAVEETRALLAEKDVASRAAQEQCASLPPARSQTPLSCPNCGVPIEFVKGELLIAPPFDSESEIAAQIQREAAESASKKAYAEWWAYRDIHVSAQRDLDKAKQRAASATSGPDKADARTALDLAAARLQAFLIHRDTTEIFDKLCILDAVAKITAPDGLPREKMMAALGAFNDEVIQLAEKAGWESVVLDDEFIAHYDGRPYMALSESEQYRVRAVIQAAIAVREKAALMVFDRADMLTASSRNGLLNMVLSTGVPSLILMTASSEKGMPWANSSPPGGIGVYWLNDGCIGSTSKTSAVTG